MRDLSKLREDMVEHQIAARSVRSEAVLGALRKVPREAFLPERLAEFAYEDSPLPIAAGQTISQPYIVALMTEALELKGDERVLEIGTGSGYAAAVLAEIAAEVYTVERIGELAEKAAATLDALGYRNVHVVHGDGTLGWAAAAPYDAIIVAAGGPTIPESLKEQLKVGGRLVMPVGADPRAQELVRVTRISKEQFKSEDIADVRFVPLVGKEGWTPAELPFPPRPRSARLRPGEGDIVSAIAACSESFVSIGGADLDPLLQRIGDARIVLLGEATHGTSEFYRMRERISQELITRKGFRFVAIEGDWPDVARLGRVHVRSSRRSHEADRIRNAGILRWRAERRRPSAVGANRACSSHRSMSAYRGEARTSRLDNVISAYVPSATPRRSSARSALRKPLYCESIHAVTRTRKLSGYALLASGAS